MGVNHLESFATRLKVFGPPLLDWVIMSTALLTGSKANWWVSPLPAQLLGKGKRHVVKKVV